MSPPRLTRDQASCNASMYTLDTVAYRDDDTNEDDSDSTHLLNPTTQSYGATPRPTPSSSKVIFNATLKMSAVFIISTVFLGSILWLALPTLDIDDRPLLRIPKSFAQLQDLNMLLKKYRDIYPYRVIVCYVTTYLFLQAFSLPGSMYLSILGGAVWGVARALPLVCCCVATGAALCYLISAALGPALLILPKVKNHLDKWGDKIRDNRENMISFLIVLRIAPLPPHWVVNVICPHVGIGLVPFWISTALGILGVSVIHTTIGGGLDEMTSAADFHLISWRNFFGLAAVVVGVLIPVGLRYWFRKEVDVVSDAEAGEGAIALPLDENDLQLGTQDGILETGGLPGRKKVGQSSSTEQDDEDEYTFDDDADIILESGPKIPDKDKVEDGSCLDLSPSSSSSSSDNGR